MANCNIDNNLITFSTDGKISCSDDLIFQNSTTTPYIWPTVDATSNQVLSAGTTPGTMEWVDQSGGNTTYEFLQAGINVTTSIPALNQPIPFDTTLASSGGITRVVGVFSLETNKTYKLTGTLRTNGNTTANITYQWRNITDGSLVGTIGSTTSYTSTSNFSVQGIAQAFVTTTVPTTVHLEVVSGGGVGQLDAFNCVGTVETQITGSGGGGGGSTPGGTNRMIQYNNNGSFGGDIEFVWDPVGLLTPLDPIKRLLVAETGATTTGKLSFLGSDPFLLDIRSNDLNTQPTFINVSNDNICGLILTKSNQDIDTYFTSFNAFGSNESYIATTSGDFYVEAGTGPPIIGPREPANLRLGATSDIFLSFPNEGVSYKWPKTQPSGDNYILSSGVITGSLFDLEWVENSGVSSGQTEGIIQLTDGNGGFTSNSGLILETPLTGAKRLAVSSLVSPNIPTAPYAPYNLNGDFLLDVRGFGRTFTSVSGAFLDSEDGYLIYGGGNFRAKFSYINVNSGNTRDDLVIESTNSLVLEWQYTELSIVKEAKHRLPNTTPTKDTNIISAGTIDVNGIRNCEWIDRDSSFEPLLDPQDRSAYIQLNGLTSDGGIIPEFTPNNEFSNRPNFKWDPAPGGSLSYTTDRLLVATEGSDITRFTPLGSVGINKLTPFMLDVRNNKPPAPGSSQPEGDCYINIGILQTERGGLLVTNENNTEITSLLCSNGTTTLKCSSTLNIESTSTNITTGDCTIYTGVTGGNFNVSTLGGGGITMNSVLDININSNDNLILDSTLGTVLKSSADVVIENSSGSYTWPQEAPKNEGEGIIVNKATGIMQWSGFSQILMSQITIGDRLTRWLEPTSSGFNPNYINYEILSLESRNRILALGASTGVSGAGPAMFFSDDGGISWTLSAGIARIGDYTDGTGPDLMAYDSVLDRIAVVCGNEFTQDDPPLYNGRTYYSNDGGENFSLSSPNTIAGYTNWNSLKYINTAIVAVGNYVEPSPPPAITYQRSTICWSLNGGLTWDKTSLTDGYWDIAYGDNKYVAVKQAGGLTYSSFISGPWIDSTTPAIFRQITYNDELSGKFFLATTEDFTLYRSTDGINWTLQPTQIMQNPFSFTFLVNQLKYIPEISTFVVSLQSPQQIFLYSFDGIVWNVVIEYIRNIELCSFLGGLITTKGTVDGNIRTNSPRGTIT